MEGGQRKKPEVSYLSLSAHVKLHAGRPIFQERSSLPLTGKRLYSAVLSMFKILNIRPNLATQENLCHVPGCVLFMYVTLEEIVVHQEQIAVVQHVLLLGSTKEDRVFGGNAGELKFSQKKTGKKRHQRRGYPLRTGCTVGDRGRCRGSITHCQGLLGWRNVARRDIGEKWP